MDNQTRFVVTYSPAHYGDQEFLHRDEHGHLADSSGGIMSRKPLWQNNHVPIDSGQTRLTDFTLEQKPGWCMNPSPQPSVHGYPIDNGSSQTFMTDFIIR
jgi:hypothetical protein